MSRKPKDGQAKSEPSPATQAKAEQIIKRLRNLHRLGKRANAAAERDITTRQFAEQAQLAEGNMRRACRFAKEYSQADLNELCGQRRPDGLPLHWGYIPYLLSIRDKQERHRWAIRATEEGWTAYDLRAKLRHSRKPKSSGHGRTIKPAATLELGLMQLISEGRRWAQRCHLVMKELAAPRRSSDSRAAQALAEEAAAVFREVKRAASTAAKALMAQRRPRP